MKDSIPSSPNGSLIDVRPIRRDQLGRVLLRCLPASWPAWSRPSFVDSVLKGCLGISGPVWRHACFHVGRSIESFARSDALNPHYLSRGIGTALAQASIRWAHGHDYQAIIAPGTPDALFAFSVAAGRPKQEFHSRLMVLWLRNA